MSYVYYPHVNPTGKNASPNPTQAYAATHNLMNHQMVTNLNSSSSNQGGHLQPPADLHPHHHPHPHHAQPQPLPSTINYGQIANVNHEMNFSVYPVSQMKENRFAVPNQTLLKPLRKRAFSKRSKTGCLTCRERRIKCDECRPICKNCEKSKRSCKFPSLEQLKQKKQQGKRSKLSRRKAKSASSVVSSNRESDTSSSETFPSDTSSITTNANTSINHDQSTSNQQNYQGLKPPNNFLDQRFILPPINHYISMPKLSPITNTHTPIQYQIHQPTNPSSYDNTASHNLLSSKSASTDRPVYQYENHLSYPINHNNTQAVPAMNNPSVISNNPILANYNYRKDPTNSSFSTITSSSSGSFSTAGSSISTNDPSQFLYPQNKYVSANATNSSSATSHNSNGSNVTNNNSTINTNNNNNDGSKFRSPSVPMFQQGSFPSPVSYWPQYVYPGVNNLHVKKITASLPIEKGMSLDSNQIISDHA